jgi:outer membrane protein assembly factor BamA
MRLVLSRRGQFAWQVFLAFQAALFVLAHPFSIFACDASAPQLETRMAIMEEQQEARAKNSVQSQPGRMERLLDRYIGENPMNKYVGSIPGLKLRFGGLPSGAGFSLGLEYLRPDLAEGGASFRASAVGSKKQWYRIGTELQFPRLAGRYLNLKLQGWRLDANSMDYYGPGANSQKSERTNYRREENSLDVSLAFKPARNYLGIGFVAGYQAFNVGPGLSTGSHSSEKLYSPDQAPGIDRQTHYLRLGAFLEVDSREKPNDPHAGTHFLVKFDRFSDRKYDLYSFDRIDGSLEQYIPFYNRKRVIALRARTVLSYANADNRVPFYMQPTLGGSSDLRGYRGNRFYDNNLFLVSSEYRWEVFTLMDAALFMDAGKVFRRDGDFDVNHMESAVGFGFRFRTREAVVFRIDGAFSHEGLGLWFAFDHVF